jgi:hypothetical protein
MAEWRGFSNRDDPMGKIVILAGLLAGAAMFTGTPAKAELGCTCIKLGAPAMCTSGVTACTLQGGGVCVLPVQLHPDENASPAPPPPQNEENVSRMPVSATRLRLAAGPFVCLWPEG